MQKQLQNVFIFQFYIYINMKKEAQQKYSPSLRFWHWGNTLVILGSLVTVLINSTLFDGGSARDFVQKELTDAGANVSPEQARALVHGLEDQVWGIHIYFGYVLAALFLYRIVVEIRADKNQRVIHKFLDALKTYSSNQAFKSTARYELGIKLLYLVFYTLLLIMVVTGLSVAFDDSLRISRSLSHSLKEIHGFCMYPILGFIVLHVGGVYFAERKNKKGIVSDMINGGETNN
ncbi:cytochrome b/b6 domain-containing protein [Pedobacter montanisoli]|uniref:Cytochrome b/b6 domain-containing protein n=1 Tax=Pedobacter montanisoli TaxID=2923277 RepID=A0ABS9ZXD1_9SPHI|nr:cytochrome b/b6 domain-containing protein [Pedobacter montanisoli]MCJ0742955.1 cytochrome b/b6 domain-containing protein [Pedobacter montanisoli]